jgi:hypothetical protein
MRMSEKRQVPTASQVFVAWSGRASEFGRREIVRSKRRGRSARRRVRSRTIVSVALLDTNPFEAWQKTMGEMENERQESKQER